MTHNTIPLSQARPPSGLQLPLTLKWRRCMDMPCRMVSLQSVRLGEDVFVGGGVADKFSIKSRFAEDDQQTVYKYHPPTDQWVPLPRYECVWFAMATLTNKLMLVGGLNTSRMVTNQIAVWDTDRMSRGWTYPYPPMPTPRHSPGVATHDKRLVVAGGSMSLGIDRLATVEVLDTTSCQWLSTSPLPVRCSAMTAAIVSQELYLLGGTLTTEALVVSLPEITSTSIYPATSAKWRTLTAPPLESSAAISVHGSVLAVGGRHGNDHSTAIHVYQPAMNNWKKVGDLHSPRSLCSCALLPSGEILVAGGVDSNGRNSRVDAATL